MKKIFFLSLIAVLFLTSVVYAQDADYGRKVITILASPEMAGRGYTDEGLGRAARFVRNEFEKIGVLPVEGTYVQNFTYPVRVVDRCRLSVNGKELKTGEEYIVYPTSPSVSGEYKVITVKPKSIGQLKSLLRKGARFNGKVLLLDTRQAVKDKELKEQITNPANYAAFNPAGIVVLDSNEYMYNISKYMPSSGFFQAFLYRDAFPSGKVKKVSINLETSKENSYKAQNIFGTLQGREYPDSFIVITAHYDHLGKMGDAYFPGANDNASGVAMMLTIAKSIKEKRFRPKYSLLFIALAGEEVGLYGSEYCAANPPVPVSRMKALINLDMVGTGSDGITVVNGEKYPWIYKMICDVNNDNQLVKEVKKRGESCNSDHCPFDKKGVPSVFIYSLGKEHLEYHNVFDRAAKLPMTKFAEIARLVELTLYSF